MSARRSKGRRSKRSGARRGRSGARRGGLGRLAGIVGLLAVGITGVAIGIGIGTGWIGGGVLEREEGVDTTLDAPAPWTGPNGEVEVEVLNGGGVAGMAGRATERLRRAGFDVVLYGNAEAFDPERASVVIARSGSTQMARAVADTLGIDNVLSEPNPNLYVDVTVVVGREWTGEPQAAPDGAGKAGRSWDPRSWFGG